MNSKEYYALERKLSLSEEERALKAVFETYGNIYSFIDLSTKEKSDPPDFLFNNGEYGFEMTTPINEDIEKCNKRLTTISIAISNKVSKAIGKDLRFSFIGNPWIDFRMFGNKEKDRVIDQLIDYSLNNKLNELNGTISIENFNNWNILKYYFGSIIVSSKYTGIEINQILVNSLDKEWVLKRLEAKQAKTNYPDIPMTLVLHINAYFEHPLEDYDKDVEMLKEIDYSVYTRFEHIFFVYIVKGEKYVEKLK